MYDAGRVSCWLLLFASCVLPFRVCPRARARIRTRARLKLNLSRVSIFPLVLVLILVLVLVLVPIQRVMSCYVMLCQASGGHLIPEVPRLRHVSGFSSVFVTSRIVGFLICGCRAASQILMQLSVPAAPPVRGSRSPCAVQRSASLSTVYLHSRSRSRASEGSRWVLVLVLVLGQVIGRRCKHQHQH